MFNGFVHSKFPFSIAMLVSTREYDFVLFWDLQPSRGIIISVQNGGAGAQPSDLWFWRGTYHLFPRNKLLWYNLLFRGYDMEPQKMMNDMVGKFMFQGPLFFSADVLNNFKQEMNMCSSQESGMGQPPTSINSVLANLLKAPSMWSAVAPLWFEEALADLHCGLRTLKQNDWWFQQSQAYNVVPPSYKSVYDPI